MERMKHKNVFNGLAGYGFTGNWRKLPLVPGILVLIFFSTNTFSQSIEIIRDTRIDTLVNRYKEVHQLKESIDGFRIQITAGSNRNTVYQVKSKFYTLFPNVQQYLIYQAPNFKLRVGNYRTRLEAYKDLQKFQSDFNGAFIIRDEIKISEL